jgi:hypothetical protein
MSEGQLSPNPATVACAHLLAIHSNMLPAQLRDKASKAVGAMIHHGRHSLMNQTRAVGHVDDMDAFSRRSKELTNMAEEKEGEKLPFLMPSKQRMSSDLKEPYAVAQGIDHEPAFVWWVPFTLKKWNHIIASVSKRYNK